MVDFRLPIFTRLTFLNSQKAVFFFNVISHKSLGRSLKYQIEMFTFKSSSFYRFKEEAIPATVDVVVVVVGHDKTLKTF